MRQGSCSSVGCHYPGLLYQPLLCASLCFLVAPVQLFLHPLSEGDEGTSLAWARQQCTAVQRQEWSGEAVGRNPIGWYHCQNSPSGPTILSYRALGNRQRSKGESESERLCTPSFTELRGCCKTAKNSNPLCGSSSRDNELDLLVFTRKLVCSKPGCEFTAS